MMEKKRQRIINDDAILEILRVNRVYPTMRAADIAVLIKGRGLAETISTSTINSVIKCGSLEAYNAYKAEKRKRFHDQKAEPEQTLMQIREEAPKEGAEMSQAARIMIEQQRDMIAEQLSLIEAADGLARKMEALNDSVTAFGKNPLLEMVKLNQTIDQLAAGLDGALGLDLELEKK